MLQPAHIGHLAMLRSLIRQGAQDGNFDPELGESSPQAEAFFAKLKRALVTGYFVEERGGKIDTVSVPAMYTGPTTATPGRQPVGIRALPRHQLRLRAMACGPRSGRARRRPRSLAAGCAFRDRARSKNLHRPDPARVQLHRCTATPARRLRLSPGRRYTALALVPAYRRTGRRGIAPARRRRSARRAKLAASSTSDRRHAVERPWARLVMSSSRDNALNVLGGALAPCSVGRAPASFATAVAIPARRTRECTRSARS